MAVGGHDHQTGHHSEARAGRVPHVQGWKEHNSAQEEGHQHQQAVDNIKCRVLRWYSGWVLDIDKPKPSTPRLIPKYPKGCLLKNPSYL